MTTTAPVRVDHPLAARPVEGLVVERDCRADYVHGPRDEVVVAIGGHRHRISEDRVESAY